MERFVYEKNKTKEISFPLGGIGTGCIGLAGNGRLIDWEIFNRPNKGSINGFSHFAVKAETLGDRVIDARVLNGDLLPPYTGEKNMDPFQQYGFGVHRGTMAGMPHFRDAEFHGEYPFANVKFIEDKFPGRVEMTAFNPFVPLNDKDSSIPGAFFEIDVENTTDEILMYTIALSVSNPFTLNSINRYSSVKNIHMITLTSTTYEQDDPEYGDLTIATDADNISYQEYWYRGAWFDELGIYWQDFTSAGKLKNRTYTQPGKRDTCTLAVHIKVDSRERKTIRFIITWNFPNCHNYWNPERCGCSGQGCKFAKPLTWKNYYATVFNDSSESAIYCLENWKRLYSQTLQFKNALFNSTLPPVVIEAISANLSILKSPTCLRLEDGSFYGFEGCHCSSGCCEGSCTHVWNYAYALPFLFPKLERSMRDLDYKYNQREDGKMSFRLQLPLGREASKFRACADGQFGGVIKTYREWKISGNTDWLRKHWKAVKKSIEFAWAETNEDRWDADKDGVLEGRQHHTLDMELFGPNPWLTGFYLAALKAGAEMAEHLGEKKKADEYRTLFHKGKRWVDENLFNGEYYYQLIDLKDKSILETFGAEDLYWNDEAKEIKYQIGEGCEIDQVVAQWHANLCGLGEIFDREKTRKALKSIYKYNFKKSMRDFFNPCRIFCLNDEAGVVICAYPDGKYKPVIPVPYAEETMNRFEYQVAVHMIQEGMVEEGLEIVKAIRDRYDGEKRNPWNEFECGSNYARSMASYALLLAFSGFMYDMVEKMLGFNPVRTVKGRFSTFWSLDCGWGIFHMDKEGIELKVLYGELELKKLKLPFLEDKFIKSVLLNGKNIEYDKQKGDVLLCVKMKEGDLLRLKVELEGLF